MKRIIAIIISTGLLSATMACTSTPVTTPTTTPAQTPSSIPTTTTTKPEIREAELKYDNGNGSVISQVFYSPTDLNLYGYLIDFVPPSVPFKIQKIAIYGIARYCPV